MGICDFDDLIRTTLVKCERLGQLTHFVPRVLSLPPEGGRERTLGTRLHRNICDASDLSFHLFFRSYPSSLWK